MNEKIFVTSVMWIEGTSYKMDFKLTHSIAVPHCGNKIRTHLVVIKEQK